MLRAGVVGIRGSIYDRATAAMRDNEYVPGVQSHLHGIQFKTGCSWPTFSICDLTSSRAPPETCRFEALEIETVHKTCGENDKRPDDFVDNRSQCNRLTFVCTSIYTHGKMFRVRQKVKSAPEDRLECNRSHGVHSIDILSAEIQDFNVELDMSTTRHERERKVLPLTLPVQPNVSRCLL